MDWICTKFIVSHNSNSGNDSAPTNCLKAVVLVESIRLQQSCLSLARNIILYVGFFPNEPPVADSCASIL